jgi:hypothetical protein
MYRRYRYDDYFYGSVALAEAPSVPLGQKELLLLTDHSHAKSPIVQRNPVEFVKDNWQYTAAAALAVGFFAVLRHKL